MVITVRRMAVEYGIRPNGPGRKRETAERTDVETSIAGGVAEGQTVYLGGFTRALPFVDGAVDVVSAPEPD